MTPQEATDELFKAAKRGDIPAAQAAIDAGANLLAADDSHHTPKDWAHINDHAEMVRLLNSAWYRQSDRRTKEKNVVSNIGLLGMTIITMALLGSLVSRARSVPPPDKGPVPQNNTPVPGELEAAHNQLRSVLKDPVMTDRLIQQIKDSSVTEELIADPDIARNLQRVARAIEGNPKNSPGQTTEQIRGIEDSNDRNESRNWTDKAIQERDTKGLKKS